MRIRLLDGCYISPGKMQHLPGGVEYSTTIFFYVAHDTNVIVLAGSYALLLTRDQKRKRGQVSKIIDSGSAGSFDPLLKHF
jgi:hypothetical protein